LEEQIRDWINQVLGGQVLKPEPDQKDFHETLKSGEVLVEYVKKAGALKFNSPRLNFGCLPWNKPPEEAAEIGVSLFTEFASLVEIRLS